MLSPVPSAKSLVNDGVTKFLLLDFDGVFNPEYTKGSFKKAFYSPDNRDRHPNPTYKPKSRPYDPYEAREPKSYLLTWSSDLVRNFSKLASKNDTQVVWVTTWRAHMDDVATRLSFTAKRGMFYLPWGNDGYDHFDKVPAVLDFLSDLSDDTRVVWVDDVSFNPYVNSKVDTLDANVLTVSPNSRYGVSRDEFAKVENFLS